MTICNKTWHGQLASVTFGNLRLEWKSLSPIFSVRIWIRIEVCRLFLPSCSCRTFLVGLGVYRNEVLPRSNIAHLAAQAFFASLSAHIFSGDRRE